LASRCGARRQGFPGEFHTAGCVSGGAEDDRPGPLQRTDSVIRVANQLNAGRKLIESLKALDALYSLTREEAVALWMFREYTLHTLPAKVVLACSRPT
jgi:hypothetical protein